MLTDERVAEDRGAGEPSEAAWVVALKGREAWAWERLQSVALERVFLALGQPLDSASMMRSTTSLSADLLVKSCVTKSEK